jgi:Fur family ferric uptake transcriptional regulator
MSVEEHLDRVDVASTPMQRFEEFLQSRGMRTTQQRRLLAEHVFSRHQHFDAEQLIAQLPPSGQAGHVSRPTVYRTLNEFVDAGLLRKFVLNGRAVFEHDYGYPQHDHLHCVECEKLIEFSTNEIVPILEKIAKEQRFRMNGHRLIVSGICADCAKAKRNTRHRMNMI